MWSHLLLLAKISVKMQRCDFGIRPCRFLIQVFHANSLHQQTVTSDSGVHIDCEQCTFLSAKVFWNFAVISP